jgi:aspartate/methionine/tyrosine aminotransferase
MISDKTLTEYEKLSMSDVCNISDGHARQYQSPSQAQIIAKLSEIFYESERSPQDYMERRFKSLFFNLANQTSIVNERKRIMLCQSSSSAIEILSNFLRKKGYSAALIEPTFDNIPRMLQRHNVPLVPLYESMFAEENFTQIIEQLDVQAVIMVCPNNPTGMVLPEATFKKLAEACKASNKLLVVDSCFRFFCQEMFWDQYAFLDELGLDFAIVEDTGKTWPSLDLKVGMLVVSKGIYEEVATIHDDYLLNVSAFILNVLSYYIEETIQTGISKSILEVCEINRSYLSACLQNTCVNLHDKSRINVAWLEIDSNFTGEILYKQLVTRDVHVLPGANFFWRNPDRGEKFIRIALSRPDFMFQKAIDILKETVIKLHTSR